MWKIRRSCGKCSSIMELMHRELDDEIVGVYVSSYKCTKCGDWEGHFEDVPV